MLAPSSASRPCPFERRRTISAAPAGVLATRSVFDGFSNQRKPGMSSFEPCRMPAWLTGVTGGSNGNHGSTTKSPLLTSLASVAILPERIWLSSTGRLNPSIWIISRPGSAHRRLVERPGRQSADLGAVIGVIVRCPQDLGEDRVEDAQRDRVDDRGSEASDLDAGHRPADHQHDQDLDDQSGDLDGEHRAAARGRRAGPA